MKFLTKVEKELFEGWRQWEGLYIYFLLVLQTLIFLLTDGTPLSIIAGFFGIFNVTFLLKGKASASFFGIVNALALGYISFQSTLYGEVLLNTFYIITQTIMFFNWRKHLVVDDANARIVKPREMTGKQRMFTAVLIIVLWIALANILSLLGDLHPYKDAITATLNISASVLVMLYYTENWIVWILNNIAAIVLWVSVGGNMTVTTMYVAFLINSVLAYVQWKKNEKLETKTAI